MFGPVKYDVRKRRTIPGQHGANNVRHSEYAKLLRNKQVLKRMYQMSEKQFKRVVITLAGKYAKSKGLGHDKAAFQLLERRLDTIVLRAGLAQTIMQARQMVVHGHFLLNNKKHNVPSYMVEQNDTIMLRKEKHGSSLYVNAPVHNGQYTVPAWIKVNKKDYTLEVFDMPNTEEISLPVDLLKVIEFYARA